MAQTTSLGVERLFTPAKSKAYDQLKWSKRDSIIKNPMTDMPVFEQRDVEFPEGWSLNAINIVAQKYFTGTPGTKRRETSLRDLVDRVADTITRQGLQEGYFLDEQKLKTSEKNLNTYLLLSEQPLTALFGSTLVPRAGSTSECLFYIRN